MLFRSNLSLSSTLSSPSTKTAPASKIAYSFQLVRTSGTQREHCECACSSEFKFGTETGFRTKASFSTCLNQASDAVNQLVEIELDVCASPEEEPNCSLSITLSSPALSAQELTKISRGVLLHTFNVPEYGQRCCCWRITGEAWAWVRQTRTHTTDEGTLVQFIAPGSLGFFCRIGTTNELCTDEE